MPHTNKKIFATLILLLMLLVGTSSLRAQMPVTIAPQLIPPYSLQLSSYYQGATPRLVVTLINNDLRRPGLQVRLQMTIRGRSSGVQIRTAPTAATNIFVLQSGIPVQLNLNDLLSLFNVNNLMFNGGITASAYQQSGVLPEDIYDFCFEAYEAVTGEKLSHNGCATAYITFSEPPLLNSPQKASAVKITEPTNIVFAWTPRHRPNVAEPTEYTFQIVEINNANQAGQTNTLINNPEAAFTQQKILFEEKTSNTSVVYGPAHPMLIPGRMYAWRVKADNISTNEDRSIFRNGGYSEIYYFSAVPNCPTINNMVSNTQPGTFSLSWTPVPGINAYTVSYRKKSSNLPWNTQVTNEPAANVEKLDVGEQYEYMVSFACNGYPVTTAIQTITIAKPMSIAGTITWKLNREAHDKTATPINTALAYDNGKYNKVWPIEGSKELKGAAYSVGEHATVKLLFSVDNNLLDSLMIRTDGKGKFKAEFPKTVINSPNFINGEKLVKVMAHIPGHTALTSDSVSFTNFRTNDWNTNLSLMLNTMQIQASPYFEADDEQVGNKVNKASFTFDVFVAKHYYDENLSFLNNQNIGTTITYNADEYVLLAKGNDATAIANLPKLQGKQYLLRAKMGANESYQYISDEYKGQSANEWWQQNQDKRIGIIEKIVIKEAVILSGKVMYNGVGKGAQTVSLKIKKKGVVLTEIRATSNEEGKYEMKVPTINEPNLVYDVEVRDIANNLNNLNAPGKTIKFSPDKNNEVHEDFDFDFGRKSITGLVLDQNKQPMANVLVKAKGINDGVVKTNKYGFYSFHVPGSSERVELTFESEYTEPQTQTLTLKANKKAIDAPEWTKAVLGLAGVKSHSAQELAIANPKVLGLEGNSYDEAYKFWTGAKYVMTGAEEAKTVTLQKLKSYAKFQFVFKAGKGKAKIEFPNNLGTISGSHNETIQLLVPFKDYKLEITEATDETPIIPFTLTRSFSATDTGVTLIHIDDYARLSGIVTNKEKKTLKEVKVYVEGINREVTTDENGAYSLVVLKNEAYTIHASLQKHEPYSKAVELADDAVLNISLEAIKIPEIKTLAGFEFTLTAIKQSEVNPEVYLISGSLTPPDNDVFAASNKDNTLTFDDQPVEVDTLGNASPTMDLRFNETTYSIKAFDFATVELSDDAGIFIAQMKDENGNDTRAIGGISGSDLTLKLEGESNVSKTGLALKDAKIRNSRHKEAEGLDEEVPEVVFVPENHKINSLQKEETFKVILSGSDKDSLLFTKLGKLVPTTIVKASGELTEDGLSFEGGIGFPNVAGMKLMDDSKGYLKVNKFTFSENYALEEIEVDIDDQTPELAIQKIRAKLQTVSLYGLASANFGMGIGGYIYTKKPEEGSGADTLFIKEFSFIMKEGKPSVTAALRIGGDGIGVKGLSFSQDASQEISLAYDGDEKSFMLKASGKLNYKSKNKDKDKGGNKFSASLFPVEINRFEFGTKDWSFLLMASANAKVSLGVASIKLSKLLVSVGSTGVSKSEMMDFLASDDVKVEDDNDDDKEDNKEMKSEEDSKDDDDDGKDDNQEKKSEDDSKDDDDDKENDNNEEDEDSNDDEASNDAFEIVDEKEAAWAVGFKGGLEFGASEKDDSDKKGMSADAHASLLIANINNKISVDINEIGLGIKSPAFELGVKVKFVSDEEKTGFEGEGKMKALGAGLAAKFKYYKYEGGGLALGAKLNVTLPVPLITVPPNPTSAGPIQWHGMGGGFDFDTKKGTYMVEIEGDFNSVGTPKETMYVKGGLRVLFNTKGCTFSPVPLPAIEIFGKLFIRNEEWASAKGEIDFCASTLIIDIKGQVPIIPNTKVGVSATLFAFADLGKIENSILFVGGTANADILDGLIKANAFVGLGFNADKTHPTVIAKGASLLAMWPNISPEALDNNGTRFHGVNLRASLKINTKGSYRSLLADIDYQVSVEGKVNTYLKFSSGDFRIEGSFDAKLYGNADLIWPLPDIEAGADVKLRFDGGYRSGDRKWYARGNGSATLYAYYRKQHTYGKKCNDWGEKVVREIDWWPDETEYWAKICLSAKGQFDYEQGKPFNFSASLD